MSETNPVIRLYYLPQSFPCGPQSSCCGPVGQSEEELRDYLVQLESSLPEIRVQTIDVSQKLNLQRDHAAAILLNTFGGAACPIFTVGHEVISMGPPAIPELIELVRAKLKADRHSPGGANPGGAQ